MTSTGRDFLSLAASSPEEMARTDRGSGRGVSALSLSPPSSLGDERKVQVVVVVVVVMGQEVGVVGVREGEVESSTGGGGTQGEQEDTESARREVRRAGADNRSRRGFFPRPDTAEARSSLRSKRRREAR